MRELLRRAPRELKGQFLANNAPHVPPRMPRDRSMAWACSSLRCCGDAGVRQRLACVQTGRPHEQSRTSRAARAEPHEQSRTSRAARADMRGRAKVGQALLVPRERNNGEFCSSRVFHVERQWSLLGTTSTATTCAPNRVGCFDGTSGRGPARGTEHRPSLVSSAASVDEHRSTWNEAHRTARQLAPPRRARRIGSGHASVDRRLSVVLVGGCCSRGRESTHESSDGGQSEPVGARGLAGSVPQPSGSWCASWSGRAMETLTSTAGES
jgi:hypothetical protein